MSTSTNSLPTVRDVMLAPGRFPQLEARALLKEALAAMGKFKLGIACIVDADRRLLGVVTDGDIRRRLLKVQKPISALFVDDAITHAITSPVTIGSDASLRDAVELMGARQIWDLPVVDDGSRLVGMLHLHPAVNALLERLGQ